MPVWAPPRSHWFSVATSWTLGCLLAVSGMAAGCGGKAEDRPTPAPTPVSSSASSTSGTPSVPGHVPSGRWGGEQLILTVTEAGATAEFECAAGVVTEPLALDAQGRFDSAGTYAAESGGPVSTTQTPSVLSARYTGRLVDDRHLMLSVLLPDSGTTHGPFRLERGHDPALERCL